MSASAELPKYKCHKEVWALKIKEVKEMLDFPEGDEVFTKQIGIRGALLAFEDAQYAPIEVNFSYMLKHNPVAGGYYVVYKDGYKSFSPASEFEEGYSRI